MDLSLASLVGIVAGLCSTSSFVPQVLKAWREGDTEAISKRMYIVTVSAFSLWIFYGVMIESWPRSQPVRSCSTQKPPSCLGSGSIRRAGCGRFNGYYKILWAATVRAAATAALAGVFAHLLYAPG